MSGKKKRRIATLLCIKGNKMSILQEKQKCGFVTHTTNAFIDSKSPPVVVTLEDGVIIFLHIIEGY
jgi:hypothetical protein